MGRQLGAVKFRDGHTMYFVFHRTVDLPCTQLYEEKELDDFNRDTSLANCTCGNDETVILLEDFTELDCIREARGCRNCKAITKHDYYVEE